MRYVGALSHGCDVRRMVAQEGAPPLRGRVTISWPYTSRTAPGGHRSSAGQVASHVFQ